MSRPPDRPAGPEGSEGVPVAIAESIERLARSGRGLVVVDSWDRPTEGWFREQQRDSGSSTAITAAIGALRESLGRTAVATIVVLFGTIDEEIESLADGVVRLEQEAWDGPLLRVATISKLRDRPEFPRRTLYSVDGGVFRSPTPAASRWMPWSGEPEADPTPDAPGAWPGSSAFAEAFGRLHEHALTGLALAANVPYSVPQTLVLPMAFHTLRAGGRVVWVPSGSTRPSALIGQLQEAVPAGLLGRQLRIVHPGAPESGPAGTEPIVLSPRHAAAARTVASSEVPEVVEPLFGEAYRFLRSAEPGLPLLYVVSIDGLRACATAADIRLDAATFGVVAAAYARLPGFHGIGAGHLDDPLAQATIPSLETYLRLDERYGHYLVYGVRPATPCYLLDARPSGRRYSLVRMG